MRMILRIVLILFFFGLLFFVRAFELELFYDPLNSYFQNEYLYREIPSINRWKLLSNLFYRYTLNSLISIGIIYLIFRNKKMINFLLLFFTVAFILLIILFFISIRNNLEEGYLFSFEQNFGISLDDFYLEFDDFMLMPREEQLSILQLN